MFTIIKCVGGLINKVVGSPLQKRNGLEYQPPRPKATRLLNYAWHAISQKAGKQTIEIRITSSYICIRNETN